MKDKKGFTLIELLAVIIILGVLLLVAIPSVSTYITRSKKEAFASNAKNMVKGAIFSTNSGAYDIYNVDTTYYIPSKCIPTETGGQSAFGGDWVHQYVIVTYNGDEFDYYYTAVDSTNMGIYITYSDDIKADLVKSGLKDLPVNVTVGDRYKIAYFSESCDGSYTETYNVRHLIRDRQTYDENNITQMFQLHGMCNFGGKNGVVSGDGCADYNGEKFINTGLQLFTEENYKKDFEISLNVERMEPSDQDSGVTQATLIASKLEKGGFPGFVFRFATNQLEFTQKINGEKLIINKKIGEIHSIKIVRKDQILYYGINGEDLQVFQNMKHFTEFFDSTLYIGAAQDGNGKPFRHIKASISNLIVRFGDINFIGIDNNLTTVFELNGSCTFNGKDGNITGCDEYSDKKIIDTGVKLYSEENANKDFMISFNISNYNPNGQDANTNQNTIFDCKQPNSPSQGISFRKLDDKFELTQTLGNKKVTTNKKAKEVKNVKLYRQNGVVYYMYNDGSILKLQDKVDLSGFFDDTLIFGGARDSDGSIYRNVKGTISDIVIKMAE